MAGRIRTGNGLSNSHQRQLAADANGGFRLVVDVELVRERFRDHATGRGFTQRPVAAIEGWSG